MAQPLITDFTRLITHAEQRQYLRLPFEVAEDVETLEISYSYTRRRLEKEGGVTLNQEVNIVDLALEDPAHSLVGASGSQRLSVTIHENWATPGYRPARLVPGTWYLVLGAYLIEEAGCEVSVSITQTKKETVLLRGDTHCHSEHSDGRYPVEEVLRRAKADGLDYLFLTDHNAMSSNEYLRSEPGFTVLPGVEMTYYGGHYNLYGVRRPVKTYTANTREEVLRIMREGKQSGALCSVNHPVDASCYWTFGTGSEVPLDLIEIWNGPFTKWNRGCVELWEGELKKGRVWPALGGSDCHRAELFRNFGMPCTFLYARGRSGSDILEAIRLGHAFIGMNPEAPILYLQLGDARMGDVCSTGERTLKLRVENLHEEDEVLLIDESGPVKSWKSGRCACFETEAEIASRVYVRLEVLRSLPGMETTLAAISNPIYIRS